MAKERISKAVFEEIESLLPERGPAPIPEITKWVMTHKRSATYKYLKKRGAFDPEKAIKFMVESVIRQLVVHVNEVRVTSNGKKVRVRAYRSLPGEKGYRRMDDILADETLTEALVSTFLRDLESYLSRYETLRDLTVTRPIFDAVEAAQARLQAQPG